MKFEISELYMYMGKISYGFEFLSFDIVSDFRFRYSEFN
jgi:hypothetical protein